MERAILHSDLNSFYASVEVMLNPSLRDKAVAVCGSTEERHGIVLAKSEKAKKAGVKTGMVNWEARQRCPGLIMLPPQYGQYVKYSRLAREIYLRYTDLVEPFGMDECWIDVTGSQKLFGRADKIAEEIRRTVKYELGMTVSIGVAGNKVFAKLASDMKKPDAVTIITANDFKEKIWPLPASELLYVGYATSKKLGSCGIHTIGDLANASPDFLKRLLGVNGLALWNYATGQDQSRVMPSGYELPVKSVGQGITCAADLENEYEVWLVMLELSQEIGHRLRLHGLSAGSVQITVKDKELAYRQYQAPLPLLTQSAMEIALKARELFHLNYNWRLPVRAVTVRAIKLLPRSTPQQTSIYMNAQQIERRERLDDAVEDIRRRFGKRSVYHASLAGDLKMPGRGVHEVIMPSLMYQ